MLRIEPLRVSPLRVLIARTWLGEGDSQLRAGARNWSPLLRASAWLRCYAPARLRLRALTHARRSIASARQLPYALASPVKAKPPLAVATRALTALRTPCTSRLPQPTRRAELITLRVFVRLYLGALRARVVLFRFLTSELSVCGSKTSKITLLSLYNSLYCAIQYLVI
jgi:hypothetical protein